MLKYIKHHLDTISGVEIYPIISLLLFFGLYHHAHHCAKDAEKKY